MSPDEVVTALVRGNTISPSGNIPVGDKYPDRAGEFGGARRASNWGPFRFARVRRPFTSATSATIQDAADAPAGYALANGRRAVYILATKRSDASTLSVINNIKKRCPR